MAAAPNLVAHPDGWRRLADPPTPEALKAFYAQEYFQAGHGTYAADYTEAERAHRALTARTLLHAVQKVRTVSGGRLLEVGCGEGWLLGAAESASYDVRGLDFSDHGLRAFHPGLLPRVSVGDAFENLQRLIDDGAAFDVVALEHVLEHVLDPEALLGGLRRLIAPGGVAAITVPNDFSPLQQLARRTGAIERDFWVAPPQHLNYFESASLRRFLRRLGFELRLGYASFPIDWFLLHPGSNYVANPAAGKDAHRARMAIDLMLAEQGMDRCLALGEALFACGAGRSLTVIASPAP
jgi:2-polyprenyl-3-methyl-5-hydroxy-6-metoxy-1,4-benzoquinol methylase